MHLLILNAALLMIPLVAAPGTDIPSSPTDNVAVAKFKTDCLGKSIESLINDHFKSSVSYLYKSKQYGSQFVERPGISKYLKDLSDKQWEAGMDLLKKFLQRGGKIEGTTVGTPSQTIFNIQTTADNIIADDTRGVKYLSTMDTLLSESSKRLDAMNCLIGNSLYKPVGLDDREIAHYFEEKMEDEVKLNRELKGHKITLGKMKGIGMALNIFDSNI